MIVGSHNGKVYALDQETACIRWSFDASADVRNGIVVTPWDAGDTAARPLAFFGDLLGNAPAPVRGDQELPGRTPCFIPPYV